MPLRRYIAITLRWSWLLAFGALVGGLTAFLVSRSQTPMYQATAVVFVNQTDSLSGLSYNDIQANQLLAKTYSQLVTSGPVLNEVSAQFPLSQDELRRTITAAPRRDTQLLDIAARNSDPAVAAEIANATADAFSRRIQKSRVDALTNVEEDLRRSIATVQNDIDARGQLIQRLTAPQLGPADTLRLQQLADAQAQTDSLRLQLSDLQRRLGDLRADLASSVSGVSLADPARQPSAPVSPRVGFNTILGAFLGLIIAASLAAVAEYLDDTVKTGADVERATDAALLGSIAYFGPRGWQRQLQPRGSGPMQLSGRAPVVEAHRLIRTNLEFARGGTENHTMLVTSALPAEGKSTTAASLALVLAQTGRRVLLVDSDLRRPSLHDMFGISNVTGLSTLFLTTDLMAGGLLHITRVSGQDNLLVLPSGPPPPNPAELLASARMTEIIEDLKTCADVVIFDSPPLLGTADASSLAARMDGVVIVVDAAHTRAAALTEAVELLLRAQATIWGVVLNKVKAQRGGVSQYRSSFAEVWADRVAGARRNRWWPGRWRGRDRLGTGSESQ